MRIDGDDRRSGRRFAAWAGLVLAGTFAVFLAILAPDLGYLLPRTVQEHPIRWTLLGLVACFAIGRVLAARALRGGASRDRLNRCLDGADAVGMVGLSGGLSIVAGATCLTFLVAWLPHYLLWPWARDADTFATLAQSWDAGILPYRDIRGYNFPGAIYLFWLLGKVFGWGRTWALYAVDGAGLLLLGMVLIAWSRRCLGRAFPGLASYLAFLTFYLSHNFEMVAQRDWHTSLCIVMGLLILQGWPGRTSRILSAALAAAAFCIRPHAILFLPALAAAVLEASDPPDPGRHPQRRPWHRLSAWMLMLAAFTTAAFSPLILQGIADDLLRGLRVAAYGGAYSQASLETAREVFVKEVSQPETRTAILMLTLVLAASRGATRRTAITWALALGGALLYRPIHPVQHRYLVFPQDLLGSVALAPALGWMIDRGGVAPFVRMLLAMVVIVEGSAGLPRFCNLRASRDAIVSLAHGETIPVDVPPGAVGWFSLLRGRWYPWEDYRAALIYVRASTSPSTLVANVLREYPYPPMNGPTGRLSPFRAESGVCWMLLVPIDLEPEFVDELERATDCVAIWTPLENRIGSRMRLARLAEVIRRDFRPEARFGHIEVWRRAGDRRPGPGGG